MQQRHFNQKELARRWNISHRTLERWRYSGLGPVFLKLGGRVLYRLVDVEVFERSQLQRAVKISDAVARVGHMGMLMIAATPVDSSVATPKLTDVELYAWIAQAETGAQLEYHRGFLGIDVTPVISTLPGPKRRLLADLGQAALGAFEKGLVHLVQERVGPDRFAYIAVARPKPKAAAVSLSALLLAEQDAA